MSSNLKVKLNSFVSFNMGDNMGEKMISVKMFGKYYNIMSKEGELPKNALERAVAQKRFGKPFSGPDAAKAALPKEKPEKKLKGKSR